MTCYRHVALVVFRMCFETALFRMRDIALVAALLAQKNGDTLQTGRRRRLEGTGAGPAWFLFDEHHGKMMQPLKEVVIQEVRWKKGGQKIRLLILHGVLLFWMEAPGWHAVSGFGEVGIALEILNSYP